MVWIGIFSSAPGSRRIGGGERRRRRAPRSVVVVPGPGGSEGEGCARGDASRARARVAIDPGVGVGAVTARDERYDDGSTTVFGRLGASRGDTHRRTRAWAPPSSTTVAASLVSVMAWSADARRPAGAPAETRNAPADALEPLRARSPLRGRERRRARPRRGWCARRARRRQARGRRRCSRSRPPLFVACLSAEARSNGVRARAWGAASPTRSVRGRDLGLRFCRRPPGTLSANQNAPLDFGSFVTVSHTILRVTFIFMRSIDELWRARCLVSDRRSRRGLHSIPPRALMASSDAPSARSGPDPGSFPGPYPAPFERDPSRWRRSVTPAHVDALRREGWCVVDDFLAGGGASAGGDGGAWASGAPRGDQRLATTGLMRPNRTHFANPKVRRLAPPRSHQPPPPPPLVGTPTNRPPTRRIPSPLRPPPGRAPPLLQTERPRRTCTSRTSARASPSSTLSSPPPPTASPTPSPRRRLRSPPPDPARRRLRRTRCRCLIPGDAARTVKLQHNRGGGGCFPLHYDNPGPPSRRALTCILYLNPDWTEGSRRRTSPDAVSLGDDPRASKHDRLAVFLSDRILHRVLPAKTERFCLTVWLDGEGMNAPEDVGFDSGVGDGEPRRGGEGAARHAVAARGIARRVPGRVRTQSDGMYGGSGGVFADVGVARGARSRGGVERAAREVRGRVTRDETRRRRHRADDDRVVDRGGATGWIRGGETTSRDTKRRTRADPGCAPARARRWGRAGGRAPGPRRFVFVFFGGLRGGRRIGSRRRRERARQMHVVYRTDMASTPSPSRARQYLISLAVSKKTLTFSSGAHENAVAEVEHVSVGPALRHTSRTACSTASGAAKSTAGSTFP